MHAESNSNLKNGAYLYQPALNMLNVLINKFCKKLTTVQTKQPFKNDIYNLSVQTMSFDRSIFNRNIICLNSVQGLLLKAECLLT